MKSLLTTISLAAITATGTHAASFMLDNLVVSRVGNGSDALSNAASQISLLEYTTTGSLEQTINVPSVGVGSLTASGTATSELKIRSNGNYLAVTGYSSALATVGVASTTDARRVAIYGNNGTVSTTLSFTSGAGSPYGANNIRGAIPTADGSAAWTVGHEGTTGTPNGVYYINSSSGTQLVSGNLRTIDIFGGNLFASTAAGTTTRVMQVGSGLPTTTGQPLNNLTGLPTTGSNYGSYYLFDLNSGVAGLDTLYLHNGLAIEKYSLVLGNWALNNSTAAAAATLMDFTAVDTGSGINIFGVTETDLYGITDTGGYNANWNTTGWSASLASAGTNYAFRGIDFAPVPEPTAALLGGLGLITLLRRRR